MDKNAIKKYAIWARRELIARVSQKAEQYGITEQNIIDEHTEKIQGVVLTPAQVRQRKTLIQLIRRDGYQQAMEEVAYTWFNRFIALRFMEVNDYLPGHTSVFTDDQNAFKPKILSDALHLELPRMSMDKVIELKEANKTEELYQYLLITLCNYLNTILPGMFQRIDDYTELLFPEHLLREGSVLEQLVTMIPREDWLDAVQIIGWLYQYYNAEPKDQVFANLKKNIKISKENIPAATQLFTPDWIVRYMVENSLGRLWIEAHPNDSLKSGWKYYLEEAEQEPDVQAQLQSIREPYAQMNPEDIRCIDPCMGSGHILVYLFDVLVQIYEAYGYSTREAVESIVQNNLWGLDIDDRAAQLAYFAVMMKARQYDKGWFRRDIEPHVFALQDSPEVDNAFYNFFGEEAGVARKVIETFHDAKEYGSIIQPNISLEELTLLEKRLKEILSKIENEDLSFMAQAMLLNQTLAIQIQQAKILIQKYDVVVTNPPYMGGNGMNPHLAEYVKTAYAGWNNDLYTCFIAQALNLLKPTGFAGFMTSYTWMFLNTFSTVRTQLLNKAFLQSLVQPEYHSFFSEAFVPICTFVFGNVHLNYDGVFIKLEQFYGADLQERKFLEALSNQDSCSYLYKTNNCKFGLIPGSPIAYWLSDSVLSAFTNGVSLGDIAEPRQGLATADNERFLRLWQEVSFDRIGLSCKSSKDAIMSGCKWFPYCKGGSYRKWAGNTEYLINWENDGKELRAFKGSVIRNPSYYFKTGLTWGSLTVSDISFRYVEPGFLFDSKGPMCFAKDINNEKYLLGLVNSKVAMLFLSVLAPTMDYSQGPISRIPYYSSSQQHMISTLVDECITLSSDDWNSFESSWDFQVHPIVRWSRNLRDATSIAATMDYYYGYYPETHSTVELCYILWQGECNKRFMKLKDNEEELNRIFINIYDLQDELEPTVTDKNITIRKADLTRDICSLVSYAVGCMLGRYSLDKNGLAYAGGEWDASQYLTYPTDGDGVLPISDDEYFSDDIVTMFVDWTRIVFGTDGLEDNLKYIATALYPNGGGTARELIRQYFIYDFYKDHLKIYQKRPIYWLFDAGKKNSFKCLTYMHRYRPDTVARIRTDYVHEMQARYRTASDEISRRVDSAAGSERVRLQKQLSKIQGQEEELRKYEEKIHHYADMMLPLDLDDGVKANYAKLADVLAPIK